MLNEKPNYLQKISSEINSEPKSDRIQHVPSLRPTYKNISRLYLVVKNYILIDL